MTPASQTCWMSPRSLWLGGFRGSPRRRPHRAPGERGGASVAAMLRPAPSVLSANGLRAGGQAPPLSLKAAPRARRCQRGECLSSRCCVAVMD